MSSGRRLWSEMLSYDEIAEPGLLADLARRGVDLLVAVTPESAGGAPALVHACRAARVGIGLWPMLDDRDGRWPSTANAAPFARFCRELLAALRAARAVPDEIAIDLEPPIDRVRALLRGSARALLHRPDPAGDPVLTDLVAELRRATRVTATVTPLVMLPSARASRAWERVLGTPLDLGFDQVNAMAYTSLFEGYSRGWLRRADARSLLRAIAATCAARWGARASISLGVVGSGALGDESAYRTPDELADDIAVVENAGIQDIILFGLDGIVARPPADRWLDALCRANRPAEDATEVAWRGRAALAAGTAAGIAADLVGAVSRASTLRPRGARLASRFPGLRR